MMEKYVFFLIMIVLLTHEHFLRASLRVWIVRDKEKYAKNENYVSAVKENPPSSLRTLLINV